MVSHRALAIAPYTVRRTPRSGTRSYYSREHPDPPPFTPAEDAILSAGISHVPAHGFTTTALANGARDAGYLDASINLFPSGAFALVKYHLVTQRLALSQNSPPSSSVGSPSTLDKVRNLALARLHANKSVIHRWQEVSTSIFGLVAESAFFNG